MPLNTWLIIGWFALACIQTHVKRIWQAERRGALPPGDSVPPDWLGMVIVPQYACLVWLAIRDWQQAASAWVLTFLCAVLLSALMELVGGVLLIPVVVVLKAAERRRVLK